MLVYATRLLHFYSRPCGRGDAPIVLSGLTTIPISTHAPAGGATVVRPCDYQKETISTHAPAGGATVRRGCGRGGSDNFYSRPCGRGDAPIVLSGLTTIPISTHAPAGGATPAAALLVLLLFHFYSRPCGRGDSAFWTIAGTPELFLLTPLREGRLISPLLLT